MNHFEELNLSPELKKSIQDMGYTTPTPIQAQTIPVLLAGKTDFLGMAATGTGKTAAFGIPLLEKIDASSNTTQALVLCPTRELAVQVCDQLTKLGKHKRISALAIYGGTGYGPQLSALRNGVHIVVATPGRLIDHLNRKTVSLKNVRTVVFDEADEMISMGFKEDLTYLLEHVDKAECSTWFFAATMSPDLRRVSETYLKKPKQAEINRTEMLSGTVRQVFYTVREHNKPKAVCALIDMADDFYGLIFCQTKSLVTDLTNYLRERGYKVDCIHGDKGQGEREQTLRLFKEKKINILVGSDVAARGLDVKELTHVINYSIPFELDSYVHRIGRTGRSGKSGLAMSLVAPHQMGLVGRVERTTNSKMEKGTLPGGRDIAKKKVSQLLAEFQSATKNPKIEETLAGEWTAALESMTKEEIVARFLSLSHKDLFANMDEKPEVIQDDGRRNYRDREDSRGRGGDRGGYRGRGPRRFGGPNREPRGEGRPFARRTERGNFLKKAPAERPAFDRSERPALPERRQRRERY